MRRSSLIIFAALLTWSLAGAALAGGKVHVIEIDGPINPATVNYIRTSIEEARAGDAQALIIEIDTPGGLVESTKQIVQLFYDSSVPVVVHVSPQGASAASAGMMITMAGHVATMSPGTNIGAAHPVIMGNEGYESLPKDDIMMEKVTNDTVSWVKSICDVRGRNPELAVKAVEESKSYSALEAVDGKLVDALADDLDMLMGDVLHERVVNLNSGDTVRLDTKDAEIVRLDMSIPQMMQNMINDPNVIYVLMLLGFLGVAIEFKAPGMIFPAVIGVSLILFAIFGPRIPINYAGLLLMVLGVGLLVAEVFITSYGILSVFGIGALVFGSLMLFDKPEMPKMDPFLVPDLQPSLGLVIPMALFIATVVILFGGAVIQAHRQKVMSGKEEMIDMPAKAAADIDSENGKIFVHGEYWNAVSDEPIEKGAKVVIKSIDNLLCKVERAPGETRPQSPPGPGEKTAEKTGDET